MQYLQELMHDADNMDKPNASDPHMSYATSAALSQYSVAGPVATAAEQSPHQLIEMLLSGALTHIGVARQALRRGDAAARGQATSRVIDILGYLDGILDRREAEALSQRLSALYTYSIQRLAQANARRDDKAYAEVAGLIATVKQGWDAMTTNNDAVHGVLS